jgi:biotin carboxyl carrier protein
MRYQVSLGDRLMAVELTLDGRFSVDDLAVPAQVRETVRGRQWSITLDGEAHEVTLLTHDPLRIDINGVELPASVIDERALRARRGVAAAHTGRVEVRAPMPGLLKAVHVKEGDIVEAGTALMTLEAMKMENELLAPARGRVTRIAFSAGTKVEGGAMLALIAQE